MASRKLKQRGLGEKNIMNGRKRRKEPRQAQENPQTPSPNVDQAADRNPSRPCEPKALFFIFRPSLYLQKQPIPPLKRKKGEGTNEGDGGCDRAFFYQATHTRLIVVNIIRLAVFL